MKFSNASVSAVFLLKSCFYLCVSILCMHDDGGGGVSVSQSVCVSLCHSGSITKCVLGVGVCVSACVEVRG